MTDPLLEGLRGEGRVDSEGRFSVDPVRALEKLRHFALADAERYVVHLVEAACLGGATRIDVRRPWHGLDVEFDGRRLERSELEGLLPGLLAGRWSTEDRLHPLALAVNAALGGPAVQVDVVSHAAGRTVHGCFRADSVSVTEEKAAALAGQRIRVRRRSGRGLWGWLSGSPELGVLRRHCQSCPVELTVHGERLALPVRLPKALALAVVKPPWTMRYSVPWSVLRREGRSQEFGAVVSLGWRSRMAPLVVQAAGRVYPLSVEVAAGVRALLSVPSLPTDLVRNGPLHEGPLERLVGALRAEVRLLRAEVAARFDTLPASVRPAAQAHLHQHATELAEAGDYVGAAEAAGRAGTHGGHYLGYRHAVLLMAAGLPDEATRLAGRVLTARATSLGIGARVGEESVGSPLCRVRFSGGSQAEAELHAWMLAIEGELLGGPHASTVVRHRAWLLRYCQDHGIAVPQVDPKIPMLDPGTLAAPLRI